AEGERGEVPGSGQSERDDGHRQRPPVPQRQREDSDRDCEVAQAVDVLAERRGNRKGRQVGAEIEDEQPAQRASALDAASQRGAQAAASAKGHAPERTTPAQTTAKVQLDHRAVGPHSRPRTTANASAAIETVATASSLIPISAASG